MHDRNPKEIDYRIWKIHFRAPKKKQMGIINLYFDRLLAKKKIVFNYMPHEMLLARVYKMLNIPYKLNWRADAVKPVLQKNK